MSLVSKATDPHEVERLQEMVAGLHAVVMLGSFMHAVPEPENAAELAVGGLAALTQLPLAAVAWYADGPDRPLRLVGRCAGEHGIPDSVEGPLHRLCAQLPQLRPIRLAGSQLPTALRLAGSHVLLALPLRVSTECVGFLLAGGRRGSIPDDLTLIQALGAQTSTALYAARLQRSEATRLRELGHLAEVLRGQGDLLTRALQLQEELIDLVLRGKDARAIVEHLGRQIGAPVWLLDADRNTIAQSTAGTATLCAPREAELRRVLAEHYPDRDPRSVELATPSGVRPFLVQSVSTDRETFGYLMVGSTDLGRVDHTAFQGGRLVLALRLLIERSVAEAAERAGRDLLYDALLHRGGPHTCAALATRLGYDTTGPAAVLAIRTPARPGGTARGESIGRRVTSAVREELRGRGGLVGAIGAETLAIVRPEDAEPYARRILSRLAAAEPEVQVSIGISDPHPDLGNLEPAHREALAAAALAERSPSAVLRFADLGLHRLLFDIEHGDRVEEHIDRWIGPLMRYDRANGTRFIETLRCYFAGAGHQDMSAALSIHTSTLKYRLRRIREILDLDFASSDVKFNVELALRLAEGLDDLGTSRRSGRQSAP